MDTTEIDEMLETTFKGVSPDDVSEPITEDEAADAIELLRELEAASGEGDMLPRMIRAMRSVADGMEATGAREAGRNVRTSIQRLVKAAGVDGGAQ